MTIYSHSRLSAFEQCKYRYKLKYLDKIPSPVGKSVEAHLGECVHDALEWFYKKVILGEIPELDEVIKKYSLSWQEKETDDMLIVKEIPKQNYFDKGVKFLIDYYFKHKPFDDGTLETEKKIWVNLEENFPHKIIGYVDRLAYNKEKDAYEIHDYKTANTLPEKSKFENDRQLALYSIGIKDKYKDNKPVILIWHYLNYNMKISSTRTEDELQKLKKDTIKLINEIEETKEFATNKSVLCNWCEYKQYCKAWGNSVPLEYPRNIKTGVENPKSSSPTISKYLND